MNVNQYLEENPNIKITKEKKIGSHTLYKLDFKEKEDWNFTPPYFLDNKLINGMSLEGSIIEDIFNSKGNEDELLKLLLNISFDSDNDFENWEN